MLSHEAQQLLGTDSYHINVPDIRGNTPLMSAVRYALLVMKGEEGYM